LEPPYVGCYGIARFEFLDFLRSGENDIHAFAESWRGRKRRTQTIPPPDSPPSATPDSGGPF